MAFNDTWSGYQGWEHLAVRQNETGLHIVQATTGSRVSLTVFTTPNVMTEVLIWASTGGPRFVMFDTWSFQGFTTVMDQTKGTYVWNNTTDNIHTINITSGIITSGQYKLYKL